MITIQQETDPNNKNTKNDDDDDDCVIVDNPLDNFKDLKTHKEITDGLKAKLIVDDQEVSHQGLGFRVQGTLAKSYFWIHKSRTITLIKLINRSINANERSDDELDLEHPRNDAEQIFSQQNFKDFFEENGIRKHLFSRSTDV